MDFEELTQIVRSLEVKIEKLEKRVKELEKISSCKKNTPVETRDGFTKWGDVVDKLISNGIKFDNLTVPQAIEAYENLREDKINEE